MRILRISGLLLIAIGFWIVIRPPSYPHEETVLKFGGLEAKVQEQRRVPGWAGGIALGAGLVLLVAGFRKS
jgi:hypothetical protein